MKPVVLIGGGGHARSILAMLPPDVSVVGYTAPQPQPDIDLPWLGDDDAFLAQSHARDCQVHLALGFNSDGSLALRCAVAQKYSHVPHATLIAPSAWVAPSATIEAGTAVMSRAVINAGTTIGRDAVVNTAAVIEHDCHIGDRCFISPGAIICGHVTIGSDTLIGAGAVLRNNISIAPGTVIGMGAIVTKSIETPGVYAGNPAKLIREL